MNQIVCIVPDPHPDLETVNRIIAQLDDWPRDYHGYSLMVVGAAGQVTAYLEADDRDRRYDDVMGRFLEPELR